jgi:PAS domain S-box-containing protein
MVEKGSDSGSLDDAALRRKARLKSDAFRNAIFTSAKLAVMATDANGIIQLFSVGAERMLGFTALETVDRVTVVDFHDAQELKARARAVSVQLSTPIAPDFAALTCKAARAGEDCFDSTWIRKNRVRVAVSISMTVVRDDSGLIIGYTLIANDISARKQPGVELNGAAFSQSDLLTRMSHEMRTPLSAILGFTQLIDSGTPSPTFSQKKSIDRILQAGWHLEKLIDMTRDLALIESGALSLSLSLEPVPLAGVMLDCQTMIESQAQMRRVRVTFPSFETPWVVSADRIRLHGVLGNLLFAAIQKSDLDGAVVVDCECSSEWIRVGIKGDGDGLSAERLSRHLHPVDGLEHMAGAVDATGLGLHFAKRLVELMGGVFGVEGIDADEKLFSFYLKRVLVPSAAEREIVHVEFGASDMSAATQSGAE